MRPSGRVMRTDCSKLLHPGRSADALQHQIGARRLSVPSRARLDRSALASMTAVAPQRAASSHAEWQRIDSDELMSGL